MDKRIIEKLESLLGSEHVLHKPADLRMYSFDSALDRGMPALVVLPRSGDQVARTVSLFKKEKIPFVARGAATSLCGGPVPLNNAAVISLTRLKKIGKINQNLKEVYVEPGVVNLRLQNELAPHKLFYPPDPGSQKACTIGGNIGTNAGGPHCLKYGVTSHYIEGLSVVLPNGSTIRVHVNDPGYDLVGLFVGSEGTLGIVTQAQLKLMDQPPFVRTMLLCFKSIEDAIQSVTDTIASGILPATLEAMDRTVIAAVEAFSHAGYPYEAEAVLLVEVDGSDQTQLDEQVQQIQAIAEKNHSFETRFAKTEAERAKLWEGRRGSYPAMARLAPNVLVEDGAVPRTKLPEALKAMKQIAEEYQLKVAMLFHAGDGNLHPQIIFDERDKEKTQKVKEAGYKMLKACVDLGGTISGEHGIGMDKREAMKWLFTRETLSLFRRIKTVFDPNNLCNPDKLIPLVSKKPIEAPGDGPEEEPHVLGIETPESEDALIALVRRAAHAKKAFGVQGLGTKFKIKEPMTIDLKCLNKIIDFDKGNLTVTAGACVSIEELKKEVEKEKQYLWMTGSGSLGGALATKSSAVPHLRTLVLGLRALLPTGEVVQFGAKTMKNVAGYDAARLFMGSWGTLGTILDITFRLFPYPAAEVKEIRPQPFLFRDIHKSIKNAFDPDGIMGQQMVRMTREDIEALGQPQEEKKQEKNSGEDLIQKMGDRFWGA